MCTAQAQKHNLSEKSEHAIRSGVSRATRKLLGPRASDATCAAERQACSTNFPPMSSGRTPYYKYGAWHRRATTLKSSVSRLEELILCHDSF